MGRVRGSEEHVTTSTDSLHGGSERGRGTQVTQTRGGLEGGRQATTKHER